MPGGGRSVSPFTDCRGITPAADLATNVTDLAKFAMLQFRDRRDRQAGEDQVLHGSCPADKTGVIVLSNADDCDPLLYADRASRWRGAPGLNKPLLDRFQVLLEIFEVVLR